MLNLYSLRSIGMPFKISIVIIYAIIVVIYLIATKVDKQSQLRSVTKALLMPLLALIYFLFSRNPNLIVVFALLFGWLGDILPLPFPGAIPFGIGHLLYTFVFFSLTDFSKIQPIHYIITTLIFLCFALLTYRYLHSHIKSVGLNIMVLSYIVLISAMGIFSILLFISKLSTIGFSYIYFLISLGALLFLISDTILSERLFIPDKKPKHLAVVITYLSAQSLLALGLILI